MRARELLGLQQPTVFAPSAPTPLAAIAVVFVFIISFVAVDNTHVQQQAVLTLGDTIHMVNKVWANVLVAAESARAYVFPLSAFALFCIYPPALLATMVLEGRAAEKVQATKPFSAKEITADK
mmetsp:Transcript_95962/g.185086  ORF Transcript_95962/g.185086 Transcript_95962/m.185086 type:complete len:123 (+) Transcript_95962:213-581(+)